IVRRLRAARPDPCQAHAGQGRRPGTPGQARANTSVPLVPPKPKLFDITVRSCASRVSRRTGKRSEEHTSELQSLMRTSYAVFCLKKTYTHKQVITNETTG